jgi:hypothetical protein
MTARTPADTPRKHPENHCATCDKFWPVTRLARSCEAKHAREKEDNA